MSLRLYDINALIRRKIDVTKVTKITIFPLYNPEKSISCEIEWDNPKSQKADPKLKATEKLNRLFA